MKAIWQTAKDLLENQESQEVLDCCYDLLDACVIHRPLTPIERRFLFEALSSNEDRRAFSARFRVLGHLSKDGKHLEDLGERFMTFLLALLSSSFEAAVLARKMKRVHDEDSDLLKVFDYILGVLKYNSKSFTEVDLDLLVTDVCDISGRTTSIMDLTKANQIIDALVTYSCLPRMSLQGCVELLTGIFASVKSLRDEAWHTLERLLGSHHGHAILNSLTTLLKEATPGATSGQVRGACQVMANMLKSDEVANPLPSQLPKLVSAVRQSLGFDSLRLEIDVMGLVLELCRNDDAITNLLNEKVWSNLEAILQRCAKRLPVYVDRSAGFLVLTDTRSSSPSQANKQDNHAVGLQTLQKVAGRLVTLTDDANAEQKRLVMRLLLTLACHLDDSHAMLLIEYYTKECLLYTLNDHWQEDFRALLDGIFKDDGRTLGVRRAALIALGDAHGTGEALETSGVSDLVLEMLNCMHSETDPIIVEQLCHLAVNAATDTGNEEMFTKIVVHLEGSLLNAKALPNATPPAPFASFAQRMAITTEKAYESVSIHVARCLVRIFLRTINMSSWKSRKLYESLLAISKSNESPADARIVALKLLFRLRADTNHGIFVMANTECEDIAALLCRTADTASESGKAQESPVMRPSRGEDHVARRISQQQQGNAGTPKGPSRTSSGNTRLVNSLGRVNRPTPPLWLYPGPKGLPEEPPYYASHLLTAQGVPGSAIDGTRGRTLLRVSAWLELLLEILQQNELEWEVYSYVLVHLGAQLTNHALFMDTLPQIKLLEV